MEDDLIPPEARALIGVERTVELGEISLRDLQRYAIAADDQSPRYFDEAIAAQTAYGGIIAPPNFIAAVIGWQAGPAEDELLRDGLPSSPEDRVPLHVNRMLGGGQELEFLIPVRPGDRFTRVDRVVSIDQRQGRMGPMVIMVTEQIYRNQHGETVVRCRSTKIAR